MSEPMLTTREVAAALGIGRESARKLMQQTRGVITLPALHGRGKNSTRRMPRAVLEALLRTKGTR
jgi:transposase